MGAVRQSRDSGVKQRAYCVGAKSRRAGAGGTVADFLDKSMVKRVREPGRGSGSDLRSRLCSK